MAYLGGLLDGEGCFTLWHDTTPAISVTNTYPHVLHALLQEFGGHVKDKARPDRGRTTFEWYESGERACEIASRLLPFLLEKRRQAELMIEAVRWPRGTAKREACVMELKRLKKIDYGIG